MSNLITKRLEACESLSDGGRKLLQVMYEATELEGTEPGSPFYLDRDARISIEQGAVLHKLIRESQVERTLEIGMAYGFSTVWILDALCARRQAYHIAVDPFERFIWRGVGLVQAGRLETGERFEWIGDYSAQALSNFISDREQFDFVYIDGNHRFDDVIVDFYLADQVTRMGGLIVLDDMWLESVRTACSFISANRTYELIPQSLDEIAVFRKVGNDKRAWYHFVSFEVGHVSVEKRTEYAARIDAVTRGAGQSSAVLEIVVALLKEKRSSLSEVLVSYGLELDKVPAWKPELLQARAMLELAKGERTIAEIASIYGQEMEQVTAWNSGLRQRGVATGEEGRIRDLLARQKIDELCGKIDKRLESS